MNLLLLLAGLRVWAAPSSTALFSRIFAAISVLSLEIQAATWLGIGTLRTLVVLNIVFAAVLFAWQRRRVDGAFRELTWGIGSNAPRVGVLGGVPWSAALALGLLVLALNIMRPVEAADPYHLDKVTHIEQTGSWAYDLNADKKINILSNVYELALADLDQVPVVGPSFVRFHGIIGLFLYLAAIASARELLGVRSGWPWAVLVVVPVVFHQLVLIKNDLFVAIPGFVVLAWVVGRASQAEPQEFLWAAWLAGFSVAVKLTNLPLLMVTVVAVWPAANRVTLLRATMLGALLGILSGGLLFILIENLRWYGELMPVADMSSRYAGQVDRVVGIFRFAISLVDLGLITRVVWPGRGGWGGTFGLPFVWAIAVLLLRVRSMPEARWTLAICAFQLLAFAVVFPDADVAQRLALAPALLAIVVALTASATDGAFARQARLALVPVLLLSAAQIGRSALLYLEQSGWPE